MSKLISDQRYMLDTNVFRYKVDSHSNHRTKAKRLWRKILSELENGEAEIFVPLEVIRELEIQAYFMNKNEKDRLDQLMDCLVILPESENVFAEHLIRKLSAYIRKNYKQNVNLLNRGVEYPSISDARILINAWQNDCTLVTSNIKDYMLFPLLFEFENQKLYDLITEDFVFIDHISHEIITNDEEFRTLKDELVSVFI
ncbi:DUF4411 family protein [Lederbergia panacisoli]|uniref:DUF4411 family protein n=1 Tax=Lederbergia panacisoli TaxID=1255251 RepID=UPI00214C3C11|nr:DUF4411 family protein [Lederbergia panacisoli]MCR2822368.1 DUF4411 family protein [Lederbergia panacisoli]